MCRLSTCCLLDSPFGIEQMFSLRSNNDTVSHEKKINVLTTNAETILPTAKFKNAASPRVCILLLPFTAGPLRHKVSNLLCLRFILEYVENCHSVTPAINVKATRGNFFGSENKSVFTLNREGDRNTAFPR